MTSIRPAALAAISVFVATSATAQTTDHADSAKVANARAADASLRYWVEPIPGTKEDIIYVRNVSQMPIQVKGYEIYDCQNLRYHVCGLHTPGPRLKPGQKARLEVIDHVGRWRFKYRVSWAFVTVDSTPRDTSRD